jgi:hypothetical protein
MGEETAAIYYGVGTLITDHSTSTINVVGTHTEDRYKSLALGFNIRRACLYVSTLCRYGVGKLVYAVHQTLLLFAYRSSSHSEIESIKQQFSIYQQVLLTNDVMSQSINPSGIANQLWDQLEFGELIYVEKGDVIVSNRNPNPNPRHPRYFYNHFVAPQLSLEKRYLWRSLMMTEVLERAQVVLRPCSDRFMSKAVLVAKV